MTIGELSDEVLLNTFCYYLDGSPRLWPRLVHICRRWRRVIFTARRILHLRLFCTHGTPVLKYLDCWPTIPIVIQYGGSSELVPLAPEDEENILAALNQSDRISSIHLTVTNLLLEKLSAVERPVPNLEDLALLTQDSLQQTLPNHTFGWGTRLRRLHLTRIAYFALPQLLYSSKNIVDLQLHEVLSPWLSSPESLTDALSGMAQLQSLSLHFLPTTDHIGISLPSRKRVVLPALNRFDFRGAIEYLEDLVAGIDVPYLGDIQVTFLSKTISNFSKLREFVDRIVVHKAPHRVDILSSEHAISISLMQPEVPTCLKLQLFCVPLAGQVSSINQICIQFSALLLDVEDLHIISTRQSSWHDSYYNEQWLKLLGSFTGVKWFHVSRNLSTDIVRALNEAEGHTTVLPAMHKLYILRIGPRRAPLSEAEVSFMTSRRLSGHPIAVEYERQCYFNELCGEGTTSAKCHHLSLTRLEQNLFRRR